MVNPYLFFLGEIDCFDDLADRVGEGKASKAFRGKLNYFMDIQTREVFGCSDYMAEYYFQFCP